MRCNPFYRPLTASLAVAAALSLVSTGFAQLNQVYSENFNAGYPFPGTVSDVNGWTTNDEDTGGTYTYPTAQQGTIGQSDGTYVLFAAGDYVGFLGGAYGQAVAPGRQDVTLNHAVDTNGSALVVFGADFSVSAPSLANGNHDTFGLGLTGTGGAQRFSINFTVPTNNSAATSNITYSVGGALVPNPANPTATFGTATPYGIALGQRYKLSVAVNVGTGTFTAFYQGENPATGALIGNQQVIVANISYGGGDITGFDALWHVTSNNVTLNNNPLVAGVQTAYTGAGTNALYFDNVTVAIPEPSTCALLGAGAFGLVAFARRRRATV